MKKAIFLLFLLMLPSAFAFSLAKGIETVFFEPGLEKIVPFVINNQDGPTASFRVITVTSSDDLSGILDEVVTVSEPQVIIEAGDRREVYVRLKLPETLPYGLHEVTVRVFTEEPQVQQQYTSIVVRKALAFVIRIYSLYPGKSVNALLLSPESVARGENLVFQTKVLNIGSEDIDNYRVRTDIYSGDSLVKSVYSKYMSIPSREAEIVQSVFLVPQSFGIGQYMAKSFVEFDGKTEMAKYTHPFNIGLLEMDVLNITSRRFENDRVNKFDIEVESKWNRPSDAYAELILSDFSGIELGRFKTPTVSVEGWKKTLLPAYLDLREIPNDNYMLKVIIHYEDKSSVRTFAVQVSDSGEAEIVEEMPGMPKESIIIILLSAIIILLIVVVIFFYLHEKNQRAQQYRPKRR